MKEYQNLLANNKAWSAKMLEEDPNCFNRLADVQTPKYLWIGCSDSRVPPNEITQTKSGEMFIHRNVANIVVHTDINFMSVLQYAVEVLKVKHIIVCGHYNCGGVKAAMTNTHHGLIDNWLRNIKDVYRWHEQELNALPEKDRFKRLVELNVQEQTLNIAKTAVVQQAWANKQPVYLHGWVYDLKNGLIETISEIDATTNWASPIYAFE
jgi:carbonic anhydrase